MSRFFLSPSAASLPIQSSGALALVAGSRTPSGAPFAVLPATSEHGVPSPLAAPGEPATPSAPLAIEADALDARDATSTGEVSSDADVCSEGAVDPAPSDTDPPAFRFMTVHGMSALLVGSVATYAYELVGPEVAVKAVWAAMVGHSHRRLASSKILLDGEPFALPPEVKCRSVQSPLGNGLLSLVVLHPDAIVGGVPLQQSRGKQRKKRARDGEDNETQRGERVDVQFVYRRDAVDLATGVPVGFGSALAATLRLPFRPEWAPALWAKGRAAGLIIDQPASGTLSGVRVRLDPARWAAPLGEVVRAVAGVPGSTAPDLGVAA